MISEGQPASPEMMKVYQALKSEQAGAEPKGNTAQDGSLKTIDKLGAPFYDKRNGANTSKGDAGCPTDSSKDEGQAKLSEEAQMAAGVTSGQKPQVYLRQSINSMPREYFKISNILNLANYNPRSFSYQPLFEVAGRSILIKELKPYSLHDEQDRHGYKMLAVLDGVEVKLKTRAQIVVRQLDDIVSFYRSSFEKMSEHPVQCMVVQTDWKYLKLVDVQ